MLFTIITVSYNHGRFIEKTIKSVIFQKGDLFLEHLIIDGGLKDNKFKLKNYEEKSFNTYANS